MPASVLKRSGLPSPAPKPFPRDRTSLLATTPADADKMARCAVLVDTLRQRLGSQSVRRFEPVASHIPERAEASLPVAVKLPHHGRNRSKKRDRCCSCRAPSRLRMSWRSFLMGPPRRFRWRGVTYEVAGSQGPERIGAEWWRNLPRLRARPSPEPTRDYYLVEDADGPSLLALSRRPLRARNGGGALVRARAICVSFFA